MHPSIFNRKAYPRIRMLSSDFCLRKTFLTALRKDWILCAIDSLFWPMLVYLVWLAVLPWGLAEVMEGTKAIVFSWGIYVLG